MGFEFFYFFMLYTVNFSVISIKPIYKLSV